MKRLISEALSEHQKVEVLIVVPTPLEWNGLPVNTAAGLEMGLIKLMKPLWNILGAGNGRLKAQVDIVVKEF